MDTDNDTPVASTNKSLVSLGGNLLQPSEPGVVARCSTKTDKPSFETSQVTILMAILFGVTEYTMSGDVIALAVYRAKDICDKMGIDEDTFKEVVKRYLKFAETRKRNPLAF